MSAELHRRLESARGHLVPEWSEVRGNLVYAAILRRRARRQAMKRGAVMTLALLLTIVAGVMLGDRETKAVCGLRTGRSPSLEIRRASWKWSSNLRPRCASDWSEAAVGSK